MKKLLLLLLLFLSINSIAQLAYPYPVKYFHVDLEGATYKMAYMDIAPSKPNGEAVILFHGKNFNGYYWKDVIPALVNAGYRVVVPDQIGWGKSDKPIVHYSFPMLANNTKLLLDDLKVDKVNVVAHSMGGMLATRFAVMYPGMVSKVVLENPIGLEDYSLFVPYQPTQKLYENEKKATYESLKKYQKTYYPVWKDEYEQYVKAQAEAMQIGNADTNAFVSALTYQMIYEQPVVYYFNKVKAPVLLLLGQEDRTVVGKNLLSEEQKKKYGQYPLLGKKAKNNFKNAKLVELQNVGHIPHIQVLPLYTKHVLAFLKGE